MNDYLRDPERQITIAETQLSHMRNAGSFEEFENSWNIALGALEKVWIKVERVAVKNDIVNKFQPWQGKYIIERRKDPLLRYLKQARDSDHHSLQESVRYQPSIHRETIKGDVYFEYAEVIRGKIIQHTSNYPVEITDEPAKILLVNITNQGTTYTPPRSHLGNEIKSPDPFVVLEKGIQYYKKFIEDTKTKFFAN